MGNNKRKLKGSDILAILCFLAAVVFFLVCLLLKDTLVINLGIQSYQTLFIASAVILVGAGLFFSFRMTRLLTLMQQGLKVDAQKSAAQRPHANLSVHGEMDPQVVRTLLEKQGLTRWSMYYEQISEISDQMRQMDTYQERLNNLLVNNGADTLYDTEEILGQVEQYICKNVRAVLNFMDVADDDAAGEVGQKLAVCRDANKDLLGQTRDFVYALAEYLNDQGGTSDTRILDTYKNTILHSIKEGVL
jgi:hypothetical protein